MTDTKVKMFLVTVNFLCRTHGMELKRTVQFPAHTPVDSKITMQMITQLRSDAVKKLLDVYGISQEGGWSIIAESVIPLFIGVMTVEEFLPTPPPSPTPPDVQEQNPVLAEAIQNALPHHQV